MEKNKYNITPENIDEYMRNYSYNFPLIIDDKAGLDYKDEKTKAKPYYFYLNGKKSNKRIVKLEIRSFRGISIGAIHYYGKLIASGIEFEYIDRPGATTSNWEAEKENPLYQWTYDFDLMRPITQREIDDDPERWQCYHVERNDFTASFETKEEMISLAKECFKQRFSGEWELWVEDNSAVRQSIYQIEL